MLALEMRLVTPHSVKEREETVGGFGDMTRSPEYILYCALTRAIGIVSPKTGMHGQN